MRLDEVTQFPNFRLLILKLDLGITAAQMCCEDVAGWENVCVPCLVLENAQSVVIIFILKDWGTGLSEIVST